MLETSKSSRRGNMISVVFNCCRRPSLTELILRRFIELMPEPYELIVAYDGDDPSYINMLYDIKQPDIFLYNKGNIDRWTLINRAYKKATGNLFVHLENDFYWVRGGTTERALKAFENHPELQFIRFEFIPFHQRQCESVTSIGDDRLCILRFPPKKPSTDFLFNLSPGIRKIKFPFGEETFDRPPEKRQMEGFLAEKWNKQGLVAGAFMGENFRHIGVYDAGGHYKDFYIDRMTLIRGQREANFYEVFCSFCENSYYRTLFKRYLDENNRN